MKSIPGIALRFVPITWMVRVSTFAGAPVCLLAGQHWTEALLLTKDG
ncbi:hypothetical protein [Cyclobacterium xiamenense]